MFIPYALNFRTNSFVSFKYAINLNIYSICVIMVLCLWLSEIQFLFECLALRALLKNNHFSSLCENFVSFYFLFAIFLFQITNHLLVFLLLFKSNEKYSIIFSIYLLISTVTLPDLEKSKVIPKQSCNFTIIAFNLFNTSA